MNITMNARTGRFLREVLTKVLPPGLALVCLLTYSPAHGTMLISFEGPAFPGAQAPQPPGTFTTTSSYTESGMWFRTLGPEGMAVRGPNLSGRADDGTANLVSSGILTFNFLDGTRFDLLSFDMAEASSLSPSPKALTIVGFTYGGGCVTNDLVTDGVNDGPGGLADFETFHLDSSFVNLIRVEISPPYFTLDNVVINVPEPSGGLIVLGAFTALAGSRFGRLHR